MQNIKILKNIAKVISGYAFRGAIKNEEDGKIFVLQAKNIGNDNNILSYDLPRIKIENARTTAFVRQNDVLLSARGGFKSGVFREVGDDFLASASMYIIRLKTEKVLPEYLSIYLNSKMGINQFKKITTGVVIQTILKKDLENFTIVTPSLESQQQIINIDTNWKKREKLLNKKILLNKNIANFTINHIINS